LIYASRSAITIGISEFNQLSDLELHIIPLSAAPFRQITGNASQHCLGSVESAEFILVRPLMAIKSASECSLTGLTVLSALFFSF
jgi:hypothetical protein